MRAFELHHAENLEHTLSLLTHYEDAHLMAGGTWLVLLVAALMVLPVGASQQLARSFRGTLALAVGIGVACVVLGLAAARVWGLAVFLFLLVIPAMAFNIRRFRAEQ